MIESSRRLKLILTKEEVLKKGFDKVFEAVDNGEQVTIVPSLIASEKLEKRITEAKKNIKDGRYKVVNDIDKDFDELIKEIDNEDH